MSGILMQSNDKTTIVLVNSEAETFKLFRKYQAVWERIFKEPIKANKVILHFDQDGNLRKVEIPSVLDIAA